MQKGQQHRPVIPTSLTYLLPYEHKVWLERAVEGWAFDNGGWGVDSGGRVVEEGWKMVEDEWRMAEVWLVSGERWMVENEWKKL